MKLDNPDLLIKPSAMSSAFQTACGLDDAPEAKTPLGYYGPNSIQMDVQAGRAYSCYCIHNQHKMCRYERCDCKCHDEAKNRKIAEAWLRGEPLPKVPEKGATFPFIAAPCRHNRCGFCKSEVCECTCHKPAPINPPPYLSLACKNLKHDYCKADNCICTCHKKAEDAPPEGDPAYDHEMNR